MSRAPDLFGRREEAPARVTSYRCRGCGERDCGLSDDGGRTWFCRACAPADFFPKGRKR